MKLKQMVIPVLLIACLIFSLSPSATAYTGSESFVDSAGDVCSQDMELGETVIAEDSPYLDLADIDVTQFSYDITDSSVELTVRVDGDIFDKGNIDTYNAFFGGGEVGDDFDYEALMSGTMEFVVYQFTLLDESSYGIIVSYVNGSVSVTNEEGSVGSDITSDVSGGTLIIGFNLDTTSYEFTDLSVSSLFTRIDMSLFSMGDISDDMDMSDAFVVYVDIAPNSPLEIYDVGTDSDLVVKSAGEEIQFQVMVTPLTGQLPYDYEWDFGDGSTATGSSPSHAYTDKGQYNYSVKVTDANGDVVTEENHITIIAGESTSGAATDSEGNPMLLFGIIAVIVVAGVALVVYIMKR